MRRPTLKKQKKSKQKIMMRSFAPTRNDAIENYAFFFGPPAAPDKLSAYTDHHASTFHFPDAFVGQSTRLRDEINNLLMKSPQDWQTKLALPFMEIEGTDVTWDEIRFDVRLLNRVPYEGVSRMQTSLKRRFKDKVIRRGIGLVIESDFYATESGKRHFANQLKSIQYCIQETCNFDVLYAYLSTTAYDVNYDRKRHDPRGGDKAPYAHELMMYAIVQKEDRGFDIAVEQSKFRMSRYGVTPNVRCPPPHPLPPPPHPSPLLATRPYLSLVFQMLVIPPQLGMYQSLVPEQKTMNLYGGQSAVELFEGGRQVFESRTNRGCTVVVSEPFEVNEDEHAVQMLTELSNVGEFYMMSPPSVMPKGGDPLDGCLDIEIYDEDTDSLQRIKFDEMVEAIGTDPKYGVLAKVNHLIAKAWMEWTKGTFGVAPAVEELTALHTFLKTGGFVAGPRADVDVQKKYWNILISTEDSAKWTAFLKELDAAVKAPNLSTSFKVLKQFNFAIMITRPFIQHYMHSAILTVAGKQTGVTLFGPADMQLSTNIQVKTIEG